MLNNKKNKNSVYNKKKIKKIFILQNINIIITSILNKIK